MQNRYADIDLKSIYNVNRSAELVEDFILYVLYSSIHPYA